MKKLIFIAAAFLLIGCNSNSGLPQTPPDDAVIYLYRMQGDPRDSNRQVTSISINKAEIKKETYTLGDNDNKQTTKTPISTADFENLYTKLRNLQVHKITTNTGGYDGDTASFKIIWGDQEVGASRNQIDYIDAEWRETFDAALYEIESFTAL